MLCSIFTDSFYYWFVVMKFEMFLQRKAAEIELGGGQHSTTTNPKQDGLTQILGPDNPGRLRKMDRGISMTKLTCLQVRNSFMAAMEEKHVSLEKHVYDLQQAIARMNNPEEPDVSENSNNRV